MRSLVILFALAMPWVAWLSNTGSFGPDNGTVSDRYPTLLVAAGYAFAIWGGSSCSIWSMRSGRPDARCARTRRSPGSRRGRPPALR